MVCNIFTLLHVIVNASTAVAPLHATVYEGTDDEQSAQCVVRLTVICTVIQGLVEPQPCCAQLPPAAVSCSVWLVGVAATQLLHLPQMYKLYK
jgi:hypothetical protein